MTVRVLLFDCINTVFDVSQVPKQILRDYSDACKAGQMFDFPPAFWESIKPHPDSVEAIKLLQANRFLCWAFTNLPTGNLFDFSLEQQIYWDGWVRLRKPKPAPESYMDALLRVEQMYEFDRPDECCVITANPRFGDVGGSSAVGMSPAYVIRQPGGPNLLELAEQLVQPVRV